MDLAYQKNIDYDIRQGNTLFQISNTNIQGEIIIAAQKIVAEIREGETKGGTGDDSPAHEESGN